MAEAIGPTSRARPAARLVARAIAAARARVARDPLLAAVFGTLWLCALVPLWVPRFLPLLDLPNHLDAIAIWHRYHDASLGYSRFYRLNLIPLPYWGYFLPVHLLSYLMPIEAANKVYLSAYALGLPLATHALARQLGRSPWLALFAFPLVFNMSFAYGFTTFCVGLVVLLAALVALDRFLARPTRANAVALALLTVGLYTTHVLPWLFFGVASLVLAGCHRWRPRRVAAAFALELPSLLLAIYGFRVAQHGGTAVQAGPLAYRATREDGLDILKEVPGRLITGWSSDIPYYLLIGLVLAWLLLMLTARADAPPPDQVSSRETDGDDAAPLFGYRLELLFALAVVAYFGLPMHLLQPVDLWLIGGRFMTLIALFGALLPVGAIAGRRRYILVGVVAIAIAYPLTMTRAWWQFDRRAGAFRRVVRNIERGASTLTLVVGGEDPAGDPIVARPYQQFHAYVQMFTGGYDPYALDTGFPFVRRPENALPAPRWRHPELFNFDTHGTAYDYILTMNEPVTYGLFGPDDAGRAPLIASDGPWRLYQVRH